MGQVPSVQRKLMKATSVTMHLDVPEPINNNEISEMPAYKDEDDIGFSVEQAFF